MSRQQATEVDWEAYREVIETYYLRKDMPLKNLMKHMKDTHGFCATKAQYELQFKRWNFRKNLTDTEWAYVQHRLTKRKQEGKESETQFNDVLVSAKKVKKELSRRFPPTFGQTWESAPSPKTPEGVLVRTPQAELGPYSIIVDNLPWFRFQDGISHLFKFEVKTPPELLGRAAGPVGPETEASVVQSTTTVSMLDAWSLFSEWIPSTFQTLDIGLIATAYSRMQALCLERNPGELVSRAEKLFGPGPNDSVLELLGFAVYLLSNNFWYERKKFFRWITKRKLIPALKSIISIPTPTTRMLAAELFWEAINEEHAPTVRFFLDAEFSSQIRDKARGFNYLVQRRPYGVTPLQAVCKRGNIELAQILLAAGADANAPAAYGETALQAAAEGDNLQLVRILLEAGADVNARASDYDGRTALRTATEKDNLQLVRILLEAGANVNTPTSDYGRTALYVAARCGSIKIVQVLLEAGADVNTRAWGCDGRTALYAAARCGSIEIVRVLLEAGADINTPAPDYGRTSLYAAARCGSIEIVRVLLDAGVDLKGRNEGAAFVAAAARGHLGIVHSLLEVGIELDKSSKWDALGAAMQANHSEMVQTLLEVGVEIDGQDQSGALVNALRSGHTEMVRFLLQAGAHLDEDGYSELDQQLENNDTQMIRLLVPARAASDEHLRSIGLQAAVQDNDLERIQTLLEAGACLGGYLSAALYRAVLALHPRQDFKVIELLLDAGADINVLTSDGHLGQLALDAAAQNGHIKIVQTLLDASADVNVSACDLNYKWIALQAAAEGGHIKIVQTLLDAGADANAPASSENHGRTALQEAAGRGHIKIIQTLLDAHADVNAPASGGDFGRTALQAAAEKGHIKIVRTLLDAGADVNAPAGSKRGLTALQGAAIGGYLGIALLLLEKGADVDAPAAAYKGRTALEGAAEHGRLDMVQLLLNAGAEAGAAEDTRYKRAAELAREECHYVVAEVLESYRDGEVEGAVPFSSVVV